MFRAHLTAAQVLTEVDKKDASLVVHLGDISVSLSFMRPDSRSLPVLKCTSITTIQKCLLGDAIMAQLKFVPVMLTWLTLDLSCLILLLRDHHMNLCQMDLVNKTI